MVQDREACVAVHGFARSQTQLKWLSLHTHLHSRVFPGSLSLWQWCSWLEMPVVLTSIIPPAAAPTDISLTRVQGCGWIRPCESYDCRMHLSNKHQESLEKRRFMTQQSWRTCSTPWPHTVVKVEGGKEWGPGARPLLGSRVGCSVFCRLFQLLANWKHKGRNWGAGREEWVTRRVSYLGHPGPSERGPSWVAGSSPSCVAVVFEEGASTVTSWWSGTYCPGGGAGLGARILTSSVQTLHLGRWAEGTMPLGEELWSHGQSGSEWQCLPCDEGGIFPSAWHSARGRREWLACSTSSSFWSCQPWSERRGRGPLGPSASR